jgi:uncharacterized protein YeaO (DUF488 family)
VNLPLAALQSRKRRTGVAMIKTKRWNQPRKKSDGMRILVCRFRPRALKKEDETWDLWWKDLGPSAELHAAIYGKNGPPISWDEFRERYVEEMKEQEETIALLAEKVAEGMSTTLLCSSSCLDENRCLRSLSFPRQPVTCQPRACPWRACP